MPRQKRVTVEVNEVSLYTKEGRFFKGEIDLGKVVGKDEIFIYVQKYPLSGSICSYRRKFIREL